MILLHHPHPDKLYVIDNLVVILKNKWYRGIVWVMGNHQKRAQINGFSAKKTDKSSLMLPCYVTTTHLFGTN